MLARFTEPAGGSWVEPLDLTVMEGRIFVLDHNGEQVVEMDREGVFVRSFSHQTVPGLDIHHPHTMMNDGAYIYIGNTFPPRVYVLDPARSTLVRTIVLPPGASDGLPAVPTGMALTLEGDIVIADGQNHRLVTVRKDGTLVRIVDRPTGSWDLFKPGNINIAPDFGFWTEGGRLALVDWKTGGADPESAAFQLGCYALYAQDMLGVEPARVDLLEVNLREPTVTAHAWDAARLEAVRERVRLSIRSMKAYLADPAANVAAPEDSLRRFIRFPLVLTSVQEESERVDEIAALERALQRQNP